MGFNKARSFMKGFRFSNPGIMFLWMFWPVILSAQDYPGRQYTMRDGLPGMTIRCIHKDSRGLLWIGTDAGLCTYDGRAFRIIRPD